MSSRALTVAAGCAALAWLAGCAGGSSGAAPGGAAVSTPAPAATAAAQPYQVHFIITMANQTLLEVSPSGAASVAPPGGSVGAPAAGAVVTYPDGTTQTADASGTFVPSDSLYARANAGAIQTSPVAQPQVKIAVPGAAALPAATVVSAYGPSSVAASLVRRPAAAMRLAQAADSATNLAGVVVLPMATALDSGGVTTLQVEGTDVDDLAASLQNATVSWQSAGGATIEPIAGTSSAVYTAPNLTGSQPLTDTVTAKVTLPGSSLTYTAQSRVITIAPAGGFTVSGTLQTAGGAAIPGGAALFVQDGAPRIYPSFNWFATANAGGAYSVTIPANTEFAVSLSPSGSSAANGLANFFPAVLSPGGESSYSSGAAGAGATVALALASTSAGFDDAHDDAANAYPAPIGAVRDAWYATTSAVHPYPFDADSGLQQILAVVPPLSSLPSPASPAPVGSGLLAQWCYQWVSLSGAPALVVVSNAGASCNAPGDWAYVVTPSATPGSLSFSSYVLANGAYSTLSPLNPSPPGALLWIAGTWTQTPAPAAGAPAAESASVQLGFYGAGSQAPSAPLYDESFQYDYAPGSGLASVQISNESLADPVTGLVLQRIASISAAQSAPLNGAGGCVGTPAPCYRATASVVRTFAAPSGSFTRTYQLDDTYDGDGSEQHTLTSTTGSDKSKVVIPIAGTAASAAGGCLVCAASGLGAIYDTDGQTQIGSFTISTGASVQATMLDTAERGAPGNPVAALSFLL